MGGQESAEAIVAVLGGEGPNQTKPKKANSMGRKRRKSEVRGQLMFDWAAVGGLSAAEDGEVECRRNAAQGSQKPVSECRFGGTGTPLRRCLTV